RSACCITSRPPRKPMGTGRRTCGWMGVPTGAARRWMRPLFPFCWSICCAANLPAVSVRASAGGPWCTKRRPSLWPMARSHSRTAGKRTAVIRRSRWRPKSLLCWLPPISRSRWASRSPRNSCAKWPTPGTSTSNAPAIEIVSPDVLALVRFGLRAPDDPRMLNTVKIIDELLRVNLPQGPAWYRYNCDGYGEHEDGSPFDGTGIGRPWPLLAGERAHYELAAGRTASAEVLLGVLENSTGTSRLIPEQVWDTTDIPERELSAGKASGSACPLVWAHSEYIKLRRSLV